MVHIRRKCWNRLLTSILPSYDRRLERVVLEAVGEEVVVVVADGGDHEVRAQKPRTVRNERPAEEVIYLRS